MSVATEVIRTSDIVRPAPVMVPDDGPLTLDETIKIISLLENPAEAALVRKALRFYQVPERFSDPDAYKWGTNADLIKALHHYANPQSPKELAFLLRHIEGKRSLLEVGSSFGGTLTRMAAVMPVGSKIVSVDLDCDATPRFLNPLATLKDTCRKLAKIGANIELFVGDSHKPEVIEAVRRHGPFEVGFIDGDHSYEGVKADWENFGPMCKVVGFHDIAQVPEVNRFWNELKASGKYRTDECVSDVAPCFGIGIVYRED